MVSTISPPNAPTASSSMVPSTSWPFSMTTSSPADDVSERLMSSGRSSEKMVRPFQ